MRKNWLLALLPFLVLLGSCEMFTTSWASYAARDGDTSLKNVSITVGNIGDLIDDAANDPGKSLALLNKLKATIKNMPAGPEKAKLQAAAVETAINAAGVVHQVLDTADTLLKAMDAKADTTNLEEEIFAIVNKTSNTGGIAESMLEILGNPNDSSFKPNEYEAFVKESSSTELALTAYVLIVEEVKVQTQKENITKQNMDDYLKEVTAADIANSPNLALAKQLVTSVGDDSKSQFSGVANDILGQLK